MRKKVVYVARQESAVAIEAIATKEINRISHLCNVQLDGLSQRAPSVASALANNSTVPPLLGQVAEFDRYTLEHSIAVSVISAWLGTALGVPEQQVWSTALAGALHDIGKIDVGIDIIGKPGRLTDVEFQKTKEHPIHSYRRLCEMNTLPSVVRYVGLLHHERLDGSGYPFGYRGQDIPLEVRVVSVADVFHAMLSNRVYANAKTVVEVVDILEGESSDVRLDKRVTSILVETLEREGS